MPPEADSAVLALALSRHEALEAAAHALAADRDKIAAEASAADASVVRIVHDILDLEAREHQLECASRHEPGHKRFHADYSPDSSPLSGWPRQRLSNCAELGATQSPY